MLLPENLRRMAEAFGDEVAYSVVDGGSVTFAEWDGQANRLARGLTAAGIAPDDRVAVHLGMENALRWIVAYAAVHRAGGVAVPLNPRLAPAEVGAMLAHCGARGAVADGSLVAQDAALVDVVVDATLPAGTPAATAASAAGAVPADAATTGSATTGPAGTPADAAATTGADAAATGPATTGAAGAGGRRGTVLAWEEALAHEAGPLQVPRTDDDLADILYTSGTTGSPKGVAVRHVNASLVPPGPPSWSGGSWLHASPLCTFAGLSFVYNPMKLGLRGIYLPRFDAGRWIEVVEAERPMAVFLVPAMTHLLLDHERFATADLSSIRICAVGSAPLAPFVVERLQEKMPEAMVSNNYGMTEAGSVYCVTPQGEAVRRPGSVGQPVPPAEVRIVSPDTGEELPRGEVGEVRLRVPGRQREYFGDPEATATTWVDGWLVTGDLGRVDQDGYLYIVGRSKDVVIRGGNNVHAADVEHVVLAHPAVLEAAVVGVPHPVLGEDVVGFVVLHPGAEVTGDELRAFALEQLADYKVPRQWHFVGDLPRNATGKVVKPELRRRLEARAAG